MGMSDFFIAVASNIRNHYLELARQTPYHRAADHCGDADRNSESRPTESDSYQPSDEAAQLLASQTAPTEVTDGDDEAQNSVEEEAPAADDGDQVAQETEPLPTYRLRRLTHFNYEVRLEFQLQAIARIAREIVDGNVESAEELAAAGFGLKAAMDFKGMQATKAEQSDPAAVEGHQKSKLMVKARQASAFALQSRNFAMEAFSRESLSVKRRLDVKNGEHYQRAVNRFALRYRMDQQFSFSFLNRLNVQTGQMAETDPNSLTPYLDSAGKVAQGGTSEMMATFFEAVDAYLANAEEDLLARAQEFFDMAAAEMGLSSESIEMARSHVTQTIESFFNQVEQAVDALQSWFSPSESGPAQPEAGPVIADFQGAPTLPDPMVPQAALAIA